MFLAYICIYDNIMLALQNTETSLVFSEVVPHTSLCSDIQAEYAQLPVSISHYLHHQISQQPVQ